jgi:hypothetical protein
MLTPDPSSQRSPEEEARRFHETLERTGQLIEVGENEDTSKLPARITHVRYPDGTVKRIRFTSAGYS